MIGVIGATLLCLCSAYSYNGVEYSGGYSRVNLQGGLARQSRKYEQIVYALAQKEYIEEDQQISSLHGMTQNLSINSNGTANFGEASNNTTHNPAVFTDSDNITTTEVHDEFSDEKASTTAYTTVETSTGEEHTSNFNDETKELAGELIISTREQYTSTEITSTEGQYNDPVTATKKDVEEITERNQGVQNSKIAMKSDKLIIQETTTTETLSTTTEDIYETSTNDEVLDSPPKENYLLSKIGSLANHLREFLLPETTTLAAMTTTDSFQSESDEVAEIETLPMTVPELVLHSSDYKKLDSKGSDNTTVTGEQETTSKTEMSTTENINVTEHETEFSSTTETISTDVSIKNLKLIAQEEAIATSTEMSHFNQTDISTRPEDLESSTSSSTENISATTYMELFNNTDITTTTESMENSTSSDDIIVMPNNLLAHKLENIEDIPEIINITTTDASTTEETFSMTTEDFSAKDVPRKDTEMLTPISDGNPPSIIEETTEPKLELNPQDAKGYMLQGIYYIYHPSGLLQRVLYSTQYDDEEPSIYHAQLRYEDVEPIQDPIYGYDGQSLVYKQIK